MDEALQRINRHLKVDDERWTEYVLAYEEVYQSFRSKLDETDEFFKTYQRKINTGSHSIHTRVGIPDEFDANICLKLPLSQFEFKNSTKPGYIQIKTSLDEWAQLKRKDNWYKYKSIEKWVDEKGYLLENKIRTWMEGRVQDALTMLESSNILHTKRGSFIISARKSGPAFTLIVRGCSQDINFTVDLVPAIIFDFPDWPCNVQHKFINRYSNNEWLAVAKPLTDKERLFFRPSFTNQEREIFNNQSLYHLKSVLRLIKKLRNTNQMPYISTYHLNTLFMWKTEKENQQYWQQPLSLIFMEMLSILEASLKNNGIPCFWIRNHNLLDSLSSHQIQDACNRLRNIIYRLNPNNVEEIILGYSISPLDDLAETLYETIKSEEKSYCIIL